MNAHSQVLDEADTLTTELTTIDGSSLAIEMGRVEFDQSIATARRYPRVISRISKNILSLVTLDEETAEECMYALPRGGKPIKGPSARFAEVVKAMYGNCRVASRVVAIDRVEKVVIAEGIFHDLEANVATRAETRRLIRTSSGALYNEDMINMTGNAAGAIALRNATLGGVPRALWRPGYDAVQKLVAGDIKTLAETREKAIQAMATFGVTPEQIFLAIGLEGIEDVKLDHIPVLRGMFAALKNGEATVEEMFAPPRKIGPQANTSLSERLSARSEKAGEGFNAAHGRASKPAATDEVGDKTASGELDRVLDGDQIPGEGHKTTSDVTRETERRQPDRAETSSAATTPSTGSAKVETEAPKADGKPPLRQRIAAFKSLIDEAPTTVRAMEIRNQHRGLFADVDCGDPDEVGTAAELEAYVNERCQEIEAEDGR